mmetsp:Transcript_18544/g.20624  ORF Transcript_18544/g.20624 Transcript_18544/m.20624 type:complete len:563 (-) Transcript_18544:180-1868(-)
MQFNDEESSEEQPVRTFRRSTPLSPGAHKISPEEYETEAQAVTKQALWDLMHSKEYLEHESKKQELLKRIPEAETYKTYLMIMSAIVVVMIAFLLASPNMGRINFLKVAASGNIDSVRMLIKNNYYINIKDRYGNNSLHYLCNANRTLERSIVLTTLIHHNISLNEQNTRGNTPLMACAANGNFEYASELLDAGADPTIQNAIGQNAIDFALHQSFDTMALVNNFEFIKRCLEKASFTPEQLSHIDQDSGEKPLNTLSRYYHGEYQKYQREIIELASLLAERESDPNWYVGEENLLVSELDRICDWTLFDEEWAERDERFLNVLLSSKHIDASNASKEGVVPLERVCALDMFYKLVEVGADINAVGSDNATVLDHQLKSYFLSQLYHTEHSSLQRYEHIQIVLALHKAGADLRNRMLGLYNIFDYTEDQSTDWSQRMLKVLAHAPFINTMMIWLENKRHIPRFTALPIGGSKAVTISETPIPRVFFTPFAVFPVSKGSKFQVDISCPEDVRVEMAKGFIDDKLNRAKKKWRVNGVITDQIDYLQIKVKEGAQIDCQIDLTVF